MVGPAARDAGASVGVIVFAKPNGSGVFVSVIIAEGTAYSWRDYKWGKLGWFAPSGVTVSGGVAGRACAMAHRHLGWRMRGKL